MSVLNNSNASSALYLSSFEPFSLGIISNPPTLVPDIIVDNSEIFSVYVFQSQLYIYYINNDVKNM